VGVVDDIVGRMMEEASVVSVAVVTMIATKQTPQSSLWMMIVNIISSLQCTGSFHTEVVVVVGCSDYSSSSSSSVEFIHSLSLSL
jgi:hypothetical protein